MRYLYISLQPAPQNSRKFSNRALLAPLTDADLEDDDPLPDNDTSDDDTSDDDRSVKSAGSNA